jgi:choline transport protein
MGWQVYLGGVCFISATILQGLIALNYEDYVWQQYHGTLLAIALVLFSILFNTVLATRLPLIEGVILILHLAGFFVIAIPLWVMAPRADPHVLIEFSNNGGWATTGLSAMVGVTAPLGSLIGYDCSVHMCKAALPWS